MSTPTRGRRDRRDGRDRRRPDAHRSVAVRRRPRLPSFIHQSHHITSPVGRRATPADSRITAVPGVLINDTLMASGSPTLVLVRPTTSPYSNSVRPILQKNSTRARTDTPVGRRVRATDDRCRWMTATTARARREDDDDGDGRRTATTGDDVGRVTVRVTVHAQGARDDETRRIKDGWMDARREGRMTDG